MRNINCDINFMRLAPFHKPESSLEEKAIVNAEADSELAATSTLEAANFQLRPK